MRWWLSFLQLLLLANRQNLTFLLVNGQELLSSNSGGGVRFGANAVDLQQRFDYHYNTALESINRGNYEAALADLRKAADIKSGDVETNQLIGKST